MATSPVPSNPSLLLPWAQNLNLKVSTQGTIMGFTPAQISAVQNDCVEAIYILLSMKAIVENYAKQVSEYARLKLESPIGTPSGAFPGLPPLPAAPAVLVPAGILARLRTFVADAKNKPAYTPAIGADLGFIVPAQTDNFTPPKLTLVNSTAGNVTLKWPKQGWTGVKVQSRKPGELAWTDVGTDLFSPWVDTRHLAVPNTPEVREYRMCHLDGDIPLNNWSDVLVVTVTL